MVKKKIGIIGGKGRYGTFWADFFKKRGCEVQSADVDTHPSNEEVVQWSEVVIIAVTLMETVKVLQSLTESFQPHHLLMDVTSTKSHAVKAMRESKAEVVGLHPFCAPPKGGTFRGQTIFVTLAKVSAWQGWVREFLAETEARVEMVDPTEHDRERTVDQVLEHMCTTLKVRVMRKLNLNPAKLFRVASPVYKLTAVQMGRMYAQSADLYGALPMTNPFAFKTLEIFGEEFQRFKEQVRTTNMPAYGAEFAADAAYLGTQNISTSFALSEHLVGLMADLLEKNSMRVVIKKDIPGILEKIGAFFREVGVNLTVFHSRRLEGRVEFFIAFDRNKESSEVITVQGRLVAELAAELL